MSFLTHVKTMADCVFWIGQDRYEELEVSIVAPHPKGPRTLR